MGEVPFTFDGRPLTARSGDSLAAALEAVGHRALGRTRAGRTRSLWCGMGACQECLVAIDGRLSQRACMVEVAPGMTVASQHDGVTPVAVGPVEAEPAALAKTDLVIVGAGPAGLSAACVAAQAGLGVTVLDERSAMGGQYYKPRSEGHRGGRALDAQHRGGDALRRAAHASGAAFCHGETIWHARREAPGFELRGLREGSQTRLRARAAILATGAMERPAMVPGWTLPGAVSIGAAQTFARRYGVAPGGRILIAGHGPLGLQLACELLDLGAEVAAVVERSAMRVAGLARMAMIEPRLAAVGAGYLARLVRARVPVLRGWQVAAVEGEGAVSGAVLSGPDGATRRIAADTVCLGDGFLPQAELARLLGCPVERGPAGTVRPVRHEDGGTEVPGLWVAGDAGGLGGAQLAEAQGHLAGAAAARRLGASVPDDTRAARRLARARRFQGALWRAFEAPPREPPKGGTIVCRCEGVTAAAIARAIEAGARDPGAVKRATRCAMGRCQGRLCTAALVGLLEARGHPVPAEALFAPQLPARPVPAAALAVEKPEWGGHRESHPAARPHAPPTAPLGRDRADLVVIGAGVTGLAAALHAARAGAEVVCLDRGRAGGEASGGNAGSLHLQLLSWDFGGKAFAGGSAALRTLPLQREAIALWRALEAELGADFEMRITGGLMVAEDARQIEFLRDKAAAEARVGIETHVVDGPEIRRLAPAVSERMVAGAWCPGEGKINPLAANAALARAARAAGAVVEELTPVARLARDGEGYRVETPRGAIRAPRVLIAAGGWSAELARGLGVAVPVPVRGAPLQMIATETAPPLVPCLLAHADRHLTMKQTEVGTLLIGGAWTARTGPAGQAEVLPESLEGNLWVAARTVPAVAGLHVLRSWAAMNVDIDGAPLIGPLPGHPGVVVAATANGYTLGPLIGREAAACLLSGRLRPDLAPFTMEGRRMERETA